MDVIRSDRGRGRCGAVGGRLGVGWGAVGGRLGCSIALTGHDSCDLI